MAAIPTDARGPSGLRLLFLFLFLLVLPSLVTAVPANAARPLDLPARTDCDRMAKRETPHSQGYPNPDVHVRCLAVGSVPTLIAEARQLVDLAGEAADTKAEEVSAEMLARRLRQARAQAKLAIHTIRFARSQLATLDSEAERASRRTLLDTLEPLGEAIVRKADLRVEILSHAERDVVIESLQSQKQTLEFCEARMAAYREGRLPEPARNFFDRSTYLQYVYRCSERGVDFYGLLGREDAEPTTSERLWLEALEALCKIDPARCE